MKWKSYFQNQNNKNNPHKKNFTVPKCQTLLHTMYIKYLTFLSEKNLSLEILSANKNSCVEFTSDLNIYNSIQKASENGKHRIV